MYYVTVLLLDKRYTPYLYVSLNIIILINLLFQIKISDYRAERNKNAELLAGEPYLAPMFTCITENYISIIRILHNTDQWLIEVIICYSSHKLYLY